MRAVTITHPGGGAVLQLLSVDDPQIGAEDVLVRVHASAVNRADLLQRRGLYPAPPGVPADIPGLEFAGTVVSCGDRVTTVRPGDRVMGIVGGGGQAELVRTHERLCLVIPPGMTFEDAAAVPEAFLTAYDALVVHAGLTAGEAVLLHAAGSGVGTAAAAIATVAGARVIALSRSAGKRSRLASMGVHRALDPAAPGIVEAIRMAAGGAGVGVAIDFVGAATFALNVEVLAPQGRMVLLGTLSGGSVEVDLGALMRKRLTVIGSVLRSRPIEEKIELVQSFSRTVLPLLAMGRLQPVVDRVFPLEDVAAAYAMMERNENFGKIVLRVS